MDQLTRAGSEVVCSAEAARTDECKAWATGEWTTEECNQTLASCDASKLQPDCSGAYFGPPGTCDVTVAEYLSCVEDWDAAHSCEDSGKAIAMPESCKKVVTSCIRFAGHFAQDGTPPLCKTPTVASPPDTNDDIFGFDGCRPLPQRFVVLGDGIAACVGTTEEHCTPIELVEYLNGGATSGLAAEFEALPGSSPEDLALQAAKVAGGPGHVVVYIATIQTDPTTAGIDLTGWPSAQSQVFEYFTDTTRFPDGATFLLNTHYSLYDRCPNPVGIGVGIPLEQEDLLQEANQTLFLDVAEQRTDAVAVDHYPDFLGHGRNANVEGCHCQENNDHWLSYYDQTHPKTNGYEHMTKKWIVAFDAMYGPSCGN